ncbi:MAG: hypothetical protein KY456_01390 [Chloroflexi bacterium]|nr:hypothetical protein [Chloroflexota bacterium]
MRCGDDLYTEHPNRDMLRRGPGIAAWIDGGRTNERRSWHQKKGSSMHRLSLSLGRSLRLPAVIAVAALTLLAPVSLAQTPVSEAQLGDGPHPAHIHSGTCETLGDVVVPLTDLAAAEEATREGPTSAHAVKTSETIVDMPLQEIIDGGHAINVHLSPEEIDVYIACGDIGGAVTTDEGGRTELIIGLGELNDSGHTGVAWLGADGEQTEVTVILVEPDEMQ